MECISSLCSNPASIREIRGDCQLLEFHGYCAACWSKLSPERRAILLGKEVVIQPVMERIIPAVPTWRKVVVGLWRVSISGVVAVVAWIVWRMQR